MKTKDYTKEQESHYGMAVVIKKIKQMLVKPLSKLIGAKQTDEYENYVGVIHRDKKGNLHVDKCLVGYKYCQNLVGKTVRLFLVTQNDNKLCNKRYPLYAHRVAVVK